MRAAKILRVSSSLRSKAGLGVPVVQDEQTQIQALNSIGMLMMLSMLTLLVIILLIAFTPHVRSSRLTLYGTFGVWISAALILATFTFNPAIRAMKLVNSPAMFAIMGVIAGVMLFALRRVRKDAYGFLEVAVSMGTLLALGAKYDQQSEITVIIGFVGAIYVFVRGLTNISEHWSSSK